MPEEARRVSVEATDDGVVVVKVFGDGAEQAAREAAWLRQAGGIAGVVDLIDHRDATIVTRHAGGPTLASLSLSLSQAAVVLADVAATVALLDQEGLQHGALELDHIIVAGERAVLCSPEPDTTRSRSDLRGIGACMASLERAWDRDSGETQRFEPWRLLRERLNCDDPTMTPARAADHLVRIAHDSKPKRGWSRPGQSKRAPSNPSKPQPDQASRPQSSRRGSARRWAGRLGAVAAMGTATWLGSVALDDARPSGVDVGDAPVITIDGDRYRVGTGPGVAVELPDPCPGQPVAVLLDPDGRVWSFDAATDGATGALEFVVGGADDLDIRQDGACPHLFATGPAGRVELTDLDP